MTCVRPATPGDTAAIRTVHLAAFPTSLEANLVEQLEADCDAAISLVAEDESEIVGHILFSRMQAEGDSQELSALGLAPVAVLPDRHGQGVGSALIEAGLAVATADGAEMVFLVGEPAYYRRFGFDAAIAKPFVSPYAGKYFQAKVLGEGFRVPEAGRADYARAFEELA